MATGRPRNPGSGGSKRTPKVAGRNAPRVTVSKVDADGLDVESTSKVSTEQVSTEKTSVKKSAGKTVPAKNVPVSGVERKRQATVEAKAAEREHEEQIEAGPKVKDTSSTYRLAGILAGVAVVLGLIATLFAFHPGASVSNNKAFVDQSATDQLISQANVAVCSPFSFNYKDFDASLARAQSNLTDTALAEFKKLEKTNRQIVPQTKAAQDCQVEALGVSYMDGDDATVITQILISTSQNDAVVQSLTPRMQMQLKFVDDRWKVAQVSDF